MEKTQGLRDSRQQVGGLPSMQGCSEGLPPNNFKFFLHMPKDSRQDHFSEDMI